MNIPRQILDEFLRRVGCVVPTTGDSLRRDRLDLLRVRDICNRLGGCAERTAYAILRHNGIAIGKRDYMGAY